MNKYFVIAFDDYEAYGGFNDCRGIFDDLTEAIKRAEENISQYHCVGVVKVENKDFIVIKEWEQGNLLQHGDSNLDLRWRWQESGFDVAIKDRRNE